MNAFAQAWRVFAEALGIIRKRNEDKNAPDVKQAAKAAHESKAQSRTQQALERRDLESLRKEASE